MSSIDHHFAADGESSSIRWGDARGKTFGLLLASGTFGGGTVELRVLNTLTGFYIPVETLTADGAVPFELPPDVVVRVQLIGATTPNIDVAVR